MDPAAEVRESDDEDDDDDHSDDEVEFLLPAPKSAFRARGSVSAEAFGEWNKRAIFVPPVFPKTEEQCDELEPILQRSFLFHSLEPRDLRVVILAMKGPLVLESGVMIIQEGDLGDHLYVVTDGALECTKVINGMDTLLKVCKQGDLFGELALLYNCPRAASVVCRETSVVWELDRGTFNSIVMEAVQRKRAQCGSVLRRVPLFAQLSDTQVENIIDALKVTSLPPGTTIIQQGDLGQDFFILFEGQVLATRISPESLEPSTFLHQAGDYFGELALLRNEPRAATVVSLTDVRLLSMDSTTFKRLMGPAEEFLWNSASRYE